MGTEGLRGNNGGGGSQPESYQDVTGPLHEVKHSENGRGERVKVRDFRQRNSWNRGVTGKMVGHGGGEKRL